MMAGHPPSPKRKHDPSSEKHTQHHPNNTEYYCVGQVPRSYSKELRDIVYDMLLVNPVDRLTAEAVYLRVEGASVGRNERTG